MEPEFSSVYLLYLSETLLILRIIKQDVINAKMSSLKVAVIHVRVQ